MFNVLIKEIYADEVILFCFPLRLFSSNLGCKEGFSQASLLMNYSAYVAMGIN